ncbi:hypothetical protein BSR29_00305 [Boudabousia liubingyangii]|uniref:Lipoprotein n=1 Tax=Boudabousia liubingyangii TaxID=1921764 RepID=A0A1Q5PPK0_9ACTO|nr:hypothetical protein [Boudabousia liubingyangii]OKL48518.1 hypothetical protein BSR28_02175 [Boudabousia liubingyangii]OKL49446.1 hypothetical protein BSR29_00305 [Boudabousia liubingyangii]
MKTKATALSLAVLLSFPFLAACSGAEKSDVKACQTLQESFEKSNKKSTESKSDITEPAGMKKLAAIMGEFQSEVQKASTQAKSDDLRAEFEDASDYLKKVTKSLEDNDLDAFMKLTETDAIKVKKLLDKCQAINK